MVDDEVLDGEELDDDAGDDDVLDDEDDDAAFDGDGDTAGDSGDDVIVDGDNDIPSVAAPQASDVQASPDEHGVNTSSPHLSYFRLRPGVIGSAVPGEDKGLSSYPLGSARSGLFMGPSLAPLSSISKCDRLSGINTLIRQTLPKLAIFLFN